jgi:hypothetical protein
LLGWLFWTRLSPHVPRPRNSFPCNAAQPTVTTNTGRESHATQESTCDAIAQAEFRVVGNSANVLG